MLSFILFFIRELLYGTHRSITVAHFVCLGLQNSITCAELERAFIL